jgi:hypothetical protein
MTKQQFWFTLFIILAVLCTVFALVTAAPNLAVERNFLFLGAVAFAIAAMRAA